MDKEHGPYVFRFPFADKSGYHLVMVQRDGKDENGNVLYEALVIDNGRTPMEYRQLPSYQYHFASHGMSLKDEAEWALNELHLKRKQIPAYVAWILEKGGE